MKQSVLRSSEKPGFRVPLHHIGSVVCLGNVGLSRPLMHRLAHGGITLVLLDANGRFKARIEGPVSGNVLLRRAQHDRSTNAAFVLDTARCCVAGKIKNARQVLLRGAREAKVEAEATQLSRASDDLAASLRTMPEARDLDVVRGVEGEAARQYFACMKVLVRADLREHFAMVGRSRRPPRDRFNALLSFLYSMWMNDCRSAAEAAGLDPQIGFLHTLRPGRAAFALDLMEDAAGRRLRLEPAGIVPRSRGTWIEPSCFRPTNHLTRLGIVPRKRGTSMITTRHIVQMS